MELKSIAELREMQYNEIIDYLDNLSPNYVKRSRLDGYYEVYKYYTNEVEHYLVLRFPEQIKKKLVKAYNQPDRVGELTRKIFSSPDDMYENLVITGTKFFYPFTLLK